MPEWITRKDWPDLLRSLELDGVTVDIGAGGGGFSDQWQSATPSREHFAIDLWAAQSVRDWPHFDNQQQTEHWKDLENQCIAIGEKFDNFKMLKMGGVDAASKFEDESVDAIWLDASHNYVFVREALEAWWKKLKPGGIIGGASFVNTFHKLGEKFWLSMWIRTRKAVEDFASENELHVYTNQEEWPCYLLQKPVPESKITVVSGSTTGPPWIDLVRENHESYCAQHGLSYVWMDFNFLDRHPVWGKIFAVAKLIEEGNTDWVVWVDSDAVFNDFKKSLDQYLIHGADAIFPEWGGRDNLRKPSSGVMLWKGTKNSLELLKRIWKSPEKTVGYSGEEEAMARAFRVYPDLSHKCILVDHRHFNSMMSSHIGWGDNRDFIIHIGQVEAENRTGVLADLIAEATYNFKTKSNPLCKKPTVQSER